MSLRRASVNHNALASSSSGGDRLWHDGLMGSWGVGVFADDLAADVRAGWREALLAGVEAREATRTALSRHRPVGDADDAVFWIALAAAQHETGRLAPEVRDRALAMIEGDVGLDVYDEAGRGARRRAVLARLAERLRGPQPAPKRLRGPRAIDPGVRVGDVVRVRGADGTEGTPFAVIAMEERTRAQAQPLLLGLYERAGTDYARMPFLSTVDFTAFDGDDPPEYLALAHPHLHWLMVRRGDRLEDVGELVARDVQRVGPDPGPDQCVSVIGWQGLAAYTSAQSLAMCRLVTQRRIEHYGEAADAWRTERRAQLTALGLGDVEDNPRAIMTARLRQVGLTPQEFAGHPERLLDVLGSQLGEGRLKS